VRRLEEVRVEINFKFFKFEISNKKKSGSVKEKKDQGHMCALLFLSATVYMLTRCEKDRHSRRDRMWSPARRIIAGTCGRPRRTTPTSPQFFHIFLETRGPLFGA